MADQVVVEGRHEIEIADPLARGPPQRLIGLEARQADEGPVDKMIPMKAASGSDRVRRTHDAAKQQAGLRLHKRRLQGRG